MVAGVFGGLGPAWAQDSGQGGGGLEQIRDQIAAPIGEKKQKPRFLQHVRTIGDSRFRTDSDMNHVLVLPGQNAVLTTGNGGSVYVWDARTRKQRFRFQQKSRTYVWDAVAIPGTSEVLVADYGGYIARYDIKTGKVLSEYRLRDEPMRLAMHPDGDCFVVVGSDGSCSLWDIESGSRLRRFSGAGKSDFYTACFVLAGKKFLTGGPDDTLRIWDMESGKPKVLLAPPMVKDEDGELVPDTANGPGTFSTISPGPEDHLAIMAGSDRGVMMWDAGKNEPVWKQGEKEDEFGCYRAVLSPDKQKIGALIQRTDREDERNRLALMDPVDGKIFKEIVLPSGTSYGLAFTADGSGVYCSVDNCLLLYDTFSTKRIFPAPDEPLLTAGPAGVKLCHGGKELVTGSASGLRFLDPQTGNVTRKMLEGQGIESISVATDAPVVAAVCDTCVYVVGPEGKTKKVAAGEQFSYGARVFLSADGQTLAAHNSYGFEESVVFFSAGSGEKIRGMNFHREDSGDLRMGSSRWGGESVEAASADLSGMHGIFLAANRIHLVNLDASGDCVTCDLELKEDDPLYSGRRVLAPVGEEVSGFLLACEGRMDLFKSPPQQEGLTLAEARKQVEQLSSRSFKKRKAATDALNRAGPEVAAWLAQAKPASPEAARRLQMILQQIRKRQWSYNRKGHIQLNQEIHKVVVLADQKHWVALVGEYPQRSLAVGRIDGDKLHLLGTQENPGPVSDLESMPDGSLLVCNANGTISFYRLAGAEPTASKP